MSYDTNVQPVLIYNGVWLGEMINISTESEPVYNDVGAVKYIRQRIRAQAIIPGGYTENSMLVNAADDDAVPDYGSNRTDDSLGLIKNRLSQPRRSFYLLQSGGGNVIIRGQDDGDETDFERSTIISFLEDRFGSGFDFETSGNTSEFPASAQIGQKDLHMGPKPTVIRFEPVPNRNAARVEFEIEIHTLECYMWQSTGGPGNPIGAVNTFTYEIDYRIDGNHRTVRTISGDYVINNNVGRASSADGTKTPIFEKTVDDVRGFDSKSAATAVTLQFPTPHNYKRDSKSFKLSADRTSCRFNIIDREIDSDEPFPADVLEIEFDHEMSSDTGPTFPKWIGSISCTVTLNKGVSYLRALQIFTQLLLSRIVRSTDKTRTLTGSPDEVDKAIANAIPIPLSIRVKERSFRKKSRYTFSYTYMQTVDKASEIWDASGLFGSIAVDNGLSWTQWKNSIQTNDYNPRGTDGLQDATQNLVIDPCITNATIGGEQSENWGFTHLTPANAAPQPVSSTINLFTEPEQVLEDNPIIDGNNKIKAHSKDKTQEFESNEGFEFFMPDPLDPESSQPADNLDEKPTISKSMIDKGAGKGTRSIQQARPYVEVTMIGDAIRIGKATPAPRLLSIGGQEAELIEEELDHEIIRHSSTNPVFYSEWVQRYRIKGSPTDLITKADNKFYPIS